MENLIKEVERGQNLAGWLKDAVHCLEQYHDYAEAMREHGRGFHPTGNIGHSIEGVIEGCKQALEQARD